MTRKDIQGYALDLIASAEVKQTEQKSHKSSADAKVADLDARRSGGGRK